MSTMSGVKSGMEEFLEGAIDANVKVDLRTHSGYDFKNVTIQQIRYGALEINTGTYARPRLYVIEVNRIEWAGEARPPVKKAAAKKRVAS